MKRYSTTELADLIKTGIEYKQKLANLEEQDVLTLPSLPLTAILNERDKLPKGSGIYFFCFGSFVLYIGQASRFRDRLNKAHHRIDQAFQISQLADLRWIECKDVGIPRQLERRLILRYAPPLNEFIPVAEPVPRASIIDRTNFARLTDCDISLVTGLPVGVWMDFDLDPPSTGIMRWLIRTIPTIHLTLLEMKEGFSLRADRYHKQRQRWLRLMKKRKPEFYKTCLIESAKKYGIEGVI